MVDLSAYYQNLLPIQYHAKPKAKADIALKAKLATGDWLMVDMWKQFDVDTAVGAQLDLIGKIVGLSRNTLGFDFANKYFAYNYNTDPIVPTPGNNQGFSRVDHPNTFARFKSVLLRNRTIFAMNDSQYRTMIKLKILINNGVSTKAYIDNTLWTLFGDSVKATDNHNMTMTFTVQPQYELLARLADYIQILPVPLGVGHNIVYL